MKMKRKLGVFILIIFTQCSELDSQYANQSKLPCDNVEYHINFFNIRRGPKNFPPTTPAYGNNLIIDFLVQQANIYFKDACIQFKYCIIEKYTAEDSDLMRQYNKPYSINVYWTNIKKKVTFNGICADKDGLAGIQYYITGAGSDDTGFTRILWQYFGMDVMDPSFKEIHNPIPCQKFSREQIAFLVNNERRCRAKRWD
jgi:hypothetical protein